MRKIKFRAWDKEKKEWGRMRLTDWGSWQGASMSQNYPVNNKPEEFELVNDCRWEWCQYAGLKDKNGKEIYEGDILKQTTKLGTDLSGDVRYNEKAGAFLVRGSLGFIKDVEVIGNIYENPELLKNL